MKKAYVSIAELGPDTDGKLPEWYLIFAAGTCELEGEGQSVVDAIAAAQTLKNLSRRGIDIVVDYEHQSIGNAKAPAAGWVKEWKWVDGQGLLARIDWTDEAAGYLKAKEYRYFSPVFYTKKEDRRLVGVHSIAL
ncbi:MAG: phage protease, partial [Kiritimatiellia bacterium]